MTSQLEHEQTRPVAVVTGASSGIGQAIAAELATCGFDLVIHFHQNKTGAKQTVQLVQSRGAQATTIGADLSGDAERNRFIEQVLEWRGCPHALVNNAGADVLTGGTSEATFESKLDLLWRTDVQATICLSRRFATLMKEAADAEKDFGGAGLPTIVNMGWDQAEHGMEADAGEMFGTIKGAVMAFTKAIAKSVAPEVRVNAVAPGWIQTKWGSQTSDYWNRRATSECLLNRWGKAEDVAKAVAYLCSPQSAFINGHILPINGGFAGRFI